MTTPRSKIDLVPTRATFSPDRPVEIEIRGRAREMAVTRLGDVFLTEDVSDADTIGVDLPEGSYGVELRDEGVTARTAVEVTSDPLRRLRYGFVADYSPGRTTGDVEETVRKLHLNAVQFYDWAYRHADLIGGGDHYRDPLGREVSLDTMRRLITVVREAGSHALGYAAVYAVGTDEWKPWSHRALLRPGGDPYTLEDFLNLVDPAADDWLQHFVTQLVEASADPGFDGFHLDQYGWPKQAARPDGTLVDLATAFVAMIKRVRERLPDSTLIFNNVNDFPTWDTARSDVDAVYIEPWAPHTTLGALADTTTRARAVAATKPVVLAAYQSVYGREERAPDDTLALTMATLFSHGATQLLAGEDFRLLTDPYYPRNHAAADTTIDLLRRWYDFLVEFDCVLMEPGLVDVTYSYAGPHNDECDISFASVPIAEQPTPGAVWRRITRDHGHLVVHLINLVGQGDTLWDAPRQSVGDPGPGRLRFRTVRGHQPRVRVASPDSAGFVRDLDVNDDGDYAEATVPAPRVWSLVIIDLVPDAVEH